MPADPAITALAAPRFLSFVRFAALDNWSASAASGRLAFHASIPLRPLAEVMQPVRSPVIIRDDEMYDRVTVRIHGGGVLRRDSVPGRVIKTKRQFRVATGQFIMSRIDARNGAFGLIPGALDGAIVTNDFPVFAVDGTRLLADYLRLVTSTPQFRAYCQTLSKGTTNRQRMDEQTFLAIPIPLPPLAVQAQLVKAHRTALAEAAAAEARAQAGEHEAARFLATALGLQTQAAAPALASGKIHFVRFATMERWGELFIGPIAAGSGGKFPLIRLGDIIAGLQNGWSPKCHPRPAAPDEWAVLKLGAVSFGAFDETANKALPSTFQPKPEYEVQAGDVLISRGNALSLVGAAVFVKTTRPRLMLPDLVFRAVWPRERKVDGAFLAETLRLPFLRRQIESVATGTSPSMKKVTKPALLNLRLPLPPLPEQARIVARLDALRTAARAARALATHHRAAAAAAFATALFHPAPGTVKQVGAAG